MALKNESLGGVIRDDVVEPVLRRVRENLLQTVLPITVLLVIWGGVASYISDPGTLPGPLITFEQTYYLTFTEDPYGLTALDHVRVTFVRAIVASVLVLLLSVVFGILMAVVKPVGDSLVNFLPLGMTVPAVVIILLSLVWFGFHESGLIFAVIVAATPFGVINMWQGARDVNIGLLEMAHSFDASNRMIWRHIYIPHLLPYLFGSYRYILGMVWKVTVLGEVFGLSDGLGAMLRTHFQFGNIEIVLGYLMLFVGIVLIIEYVFLKPLEDHLFRWRT
ncbi:ABC transporter permease [Natrarchaeobius chitinivorans]|uniref:ABC transporter permease subunit n=1 Tax=Natrarchaeobius chitinivorans TaxID=1679083 RepID=A0A3N6LWB0_NATCH|nr:ABC transporter permease subunit [Natrarchaeobius chitinivorans]RQG94893.1 ABC transporter permease subunit [Natrarchaeobius chitinivorans]